MKLQPAIKTHKDTLEAKANIWLEFESQVADAIELTHQNYVQRKR